MRRVLSLVLLASLPVAAQVAPIPTPTQLPGRPFSIQKQWLIGGTGNWDYLAMDAAAQRLYIAHGRSVQVVDITSGSVVGEIQGFRQAISIALDETGSYGYVSDGPAGAIEVFDRRSLSVQASVPINCSPRSIAFEPRSKLVFAICGVAQPLPHPPLPRERPVQPPMRTGVSHVVAIDTEQNIALADMLLPGDLRFTQADGGGTVYITAGASRFNAILNGREFTDSVPQRIIALDGQAIAGAARQERAVRNESASTGDPVPMDWTYHPLPESLGHFLTLPGNCPDPQGLAVDAKDFRLFAACNDQQLYVLNATDGHIVTTLTTGPGDDVIGYDAERELIYSANGAGYGSVTIIQQDAVTDSYAVIQNLPTLARAHTLAIDSSSGLVYLVTDVTGVDLSPRGGFAPIKSAPIQGSFQVLVVGR